MTQNPLSPLIAELEKLPGVGPKSAQRLAFFLLGQPSLEVKRLAETMVVTREKIRYCQQCYNISLESVCHICSNHSRNPKQLCIVAEPKDIFAIERSREFKGFYHVLGGLISPLDGIHPEALRIKELGSRLSTHAFDEVIFAIHPTVEGEATSLFLMQVLKPYQLKITRLSYGLPIGGDIDYADQLTLQSAFQGRASV